VTPYLDDVQSRIVENYGRSGFECVAERHTGQCVNFEFSEVTEERIPR
jgi:maleate isomerase